MVRYGLLVALVVSVAVVLGGCAGYVVAPVVPPTGFVFSDISAPISIEGSELPRDAEVGMSMTQSILGLVAWGDGSVEAAAENGGLSEIYRVDYELFNVLGVYSRYTTVARGK